MAFFIYHRAHVGSYLRYLSAQQQQASFFMRPWHRIYRISFLFLSWPFSQSTPPSFKISSTELAKINNTFYSSSSNSLNNNSSIVWNTPITINNIHRKNGPISTASDLTLYQVFSMHSSQFYALSWKHTNTSHFQPFVSLSASLLYVSDNL